MPELDAHAQLRDPDWRTAIAARLQSLRTDPGSIAGPDAIAELVEAVLSGMHSFLAEPVAAILTEVGQLAGTIAEAKQEISRLEVTTISSAFIPNATDELDAIVDATAAATNQILDCVETVERVAGEVSAGQAEALQAVATRIYEACSFQDITGQRVTKVVAALKAIEAQVDSIIAAFGGVLSLDRGQPPPCKQLHPGDGAALLNGPQLPGNGVNQASIDALFD